MKDDRSRYDILFCKKDDPSEAVDSFGSTNFESKKDCECKKEDIENKICICFNKSINNSVTQEHNQIEKNKNYKTFNQKNVDMSLIKNDNQKKNKKIFDSKTRIENFNNKNFDSKTSNENTNNKDFDSQVNNEKVVFNINNKNVDFNINNFDNQSKKEIINTYLKNENIDSSAHNKNIDSQFKNENTTLTKNKKISYKENSNTNKSINNEITTKKSNLPRESMAEIHESIVKNYEKFQRQHSPFVFPSQKVPPLSTLSHIFTPRACSAPPDDSLLKNNSIKDISYTTFYRKNSKTDIRLPVPCNFVLGSENYQSLIERIDFDYPYSESITYKGETSRSTTPIGNHPFLKEINCEVINEFEDEIRKYLIEDENKKSIEELKIEVSTKENIIENEKDFILNDKKNSNNVKLNGIRNIYNDKINGNDKKINENLSIFNKKIYGNSSIFNDKNINGNDLKFDKINVGNPIFNDKNINRNDLIFDKKIEDTKINSSHSNFINGTNSVHNFEINSSLKKTETNNFNLNGINSILCSINEKEDVFNTNFFRSKNNDKNISGIVNDKNNIAEEQCFSLSTDQEGSRFIQKRLERSNESELIWFFNQIKENLIKLSFDLFGNYVIQKLLELEVEKINKEIIAIVKNNAEEMALHMYGCRVIQKIFELDNCNAEEILFSIKDNIVCLIEDQNGNHVVQKCVEKVKDCFFIIKEFKRNGVKLSKHRYGCRVVQRLFENCKDEEIREIVVDLSKNIPQLIEDQYGNYVLQHIIQNKKNLRFILIDEVMKIKDEKIMEYCMHKFASNVIEKCVMYCDVFVDSFLRILNGKPLIVWLSIDRFGNYVVQRILDKKKKSVNAVLKNYLGDLRKSVYAKHIIAKIQ